MAALPAAQAKTSSTAGSLAGLPASMQSGISATLGREDSRYLAVPVAGGFQVTNPSQRISAEFTAAGASIASGSAKWQMNLRAYGYGEKLSQASRASVAAKENRVEYRRVSKTGALTEWYVNGPVGMEQGFTLDSRPGVSKGSPLSLEIALSGNVTPQIDAAKNVLTLASDGAPVMRYSGLTARDASGAELKSWMELRGSNLLLRVDDRDAKYPLTVDPYVQTVILTTDGAAGDQAGYSVAFNDSYAVIGAPYNNKAQGAVYVFADPTSATTTYSAKLTASNGVTGDGFGAAVAIGPDNNIVVGAPFVSNFTGAAYAYSEPLGGFKTTSTFTAELTAHDGVAGDGLGYSVAIALNVIVVGAPGYENFTGSAVTYGNPAMFSTSFYGVREVDAAAGVEGDAFGWQAAAYQYTSVIGTPFPNSFTGAAYLYEPNPSPVSTPTAKFTPNDGASGDGFGSDVATDGTGSDPSTVAVGSPFHNGEVGAVYIYTKPTSGWASATVPQAKITSADSAFFDGFGFSLDLSNGVLAVGSPGFNSFAGKGYIYDQPVGGWATTSTPTATVVPSPTVTGEYFGWSTSVAPNGSALFGAPYIAATGQGAAYVETPASGPGAKKAASKAKAPKKK